MNTTSPAKPKKEPRYEGRPLSDLLNRLERAFHSRWLSTQYRPALEFNWSAILIMKALPLSIPAFIASPDIYQLLLASLNANAENFTDRYQMAFHAEKKREMDSDEDRLFHIGDPNLMGTPFVEPEWADREEGRRIVARRCLLRGLPVVAETFPRWAVMYGVVVKKNSDTPTPEKKVLSEAAGSQPAAINTPKSQSEEARTKHGITESWADLEAIGSPAESDIPEDWADVATEPSLQSGRGEMREVDQAELLMRLQAMEDKVV
jgi:hypothetical protein